MPSANATYGDEISLDAPVYRPRKFTSPTVKQRFWRDRRRRLLRELRLRGEPTALQHVLLERLVDLEWSIMRRMAQPERTEHASRELMAMHNHIRLLARELVSLGPREPQRVTIGQLAMQHEARVRRRGRPRQVAAA
jgi:hypothetical protein